MGLKKIERRKPYQGEKPTHFIAVEEHAFDFEKEWIAMEIKYENIVLRDMMESDIEDYVRWYTVEREWKNWDAPWRKGDTDEEAERRR